MLASVLSSYASPFEGSGGGDGLPRQVNEGLKMILEILDIALVPIILCIALVIIDRQITQFTTGVFQRKKQNL